jgi:RNase H-fold protein (predicted Holliday junction resolvase)
MAQTRAISRVCRSAFAHCVVLIDADLSTTPAEEADLDVSETKRKPVQYDQEDLVNCELQTAAHRKPSRPLNP